MPVQHRKLIVAVACGVVIGWFVTAFVFYPPSPGWGKKVAWSLNVTDWFTAIGTVGAASAAVWLGLAEQRRRKRTRNEVRNALAHALLTDIVVVRQVLWTQALRWPAECQLIDFRNNSLQTLAALPIPNIQSYVGLLPKLGPEVAPYVIEAYGVVLRVKELAKMQIMIKRDELGDFEFVKRMVEQQRVIDGSLERAQKALAPHVAPLVPKADWQAALSVNKPQAPPETICKN
jgi:hypothetical protein